MNNIAIAKKILGMKKGESFTVKTAKARHEALSAAKFLHNSGAINFRVVTRRDGHKWTVAAI